jgi:acetylglutamate/LysW-gamma-L-alpha-aminoadipate kinase
MLVVKLGGGEGLDMAASIADLARVARETPLVVVHGVSARMATLCAERGIPVQMLTSPSGHSSRYTPPAVRDVFVEAANQISAEIVSGLLALGIPAQVVSGSLQGERKAAVRAVMNGRISVVRDDYTGSISGVDADPIRAALDAGRVAVVAPLAASPDGLLNIDGDRAAAAIAGALQAETLVILSNVRGLYRSYPDEATFIPRIPAGQIPQALEYAQGRMKRKVLSAQEALAQSVGRVVIADGRRADPVTQALHGEGTVFSR